MRSGKFGNNLFQEKYNFWKNKKVIITGCTGFKGAWLSIILKRYGAKITGVALPPKYKNDIFNKANLKSKINFYNCDINNSKKINFIFRTTQPDFIFHFAAQSLVITSYEKTEQTYLTNIVGSSNIIEACLKLKKKNNLIITTTDKVYKNKKNVKKFVETDELGGNDPYSASKASLEVLCKYYLFLSKKHKYFSLAIARAGNVIGGGDWSLNRLFPDIFININSNTKVIIRNPNSTRPWQHVLEPLYGYLNLAELSFKNKKFCSAYNFGPTSNKSASVISIIKRVKKKFKNLKIEIKKGKYYESRTLILNSNKAKKELLLKSIWNLGYSVKKTIDWYYNFFKKSSAEKLCIDDIKNYEKDYDNLNFYKKL